MNIIEFVEARLDEAAWSAVAGEPLGYDQVCRIVDVLRAMAMQVSAYLDGSPTDQPVAAGLLPMAMIWSEHPDCTPALWFPKMIANGGAPGVV